MPTQTKIPDEMLLGAGVHKLDPELLITMGQAGMLLRQSRSKMEERKRSGRPPTPHQEGGPGSAVSYLLGEVLTLRPKHPVASNAAARKAHDDLIRGFPTFTAFMTDAGLGDSWPFTLIGGKPVDFFASLGMRIDDEAECRWLTLEQYLDKRKLAANLERSEGVNHHLDAVTPPAQGGSGRGRTGM
jgi:hypothetical protein